MLTRDDIELLMDALDALEGQHANSQLIGILGGALFAKSKEEVEKNFDKVVNDEGRKDKHKYLVERITLTKAKLIQIKDKMLAGEYLEDAL